MTRTLLIAAVAGAAALSACSSSSSTPAASPATTAPAAAAQPWAQIGKGSSATMLVIDVPESTKDTTSSCFLHYTAKVSASSASSFTIAMTGPAAAPTSCAANAVKGPFLVDVALPTPYTNQTLIDAATGMKHPLLAAADLG